MYESNNLLFVSACPYPWKLWKSFNAWRMILSIKEFSDITVDMCYYLYISLPNLAIYTELK